LFGVQEPRAYPSRLEREVAGLQRVHQYVLPQGITLRVERWECRRHR